MLKERNKINTPDGVLVRIAHHLRSMLRVGPSQLKLLIDRYVSQRSPYETLKSHHQKSNYQDRFTKDKMTIKAFFLLMEVMQVTRVTLTVKVMTVHGYEAEVTEELNLAVHAEQDPKAANAAGVDEGDFDEQN